jgi:Putative porin
MFKLKSKLLTLLAFLFGASLALAQDSGPLIDMMVKKGLINDQEAEDLRAELVKDFATTSAGKMNLGTTMTELKIAGDLRVRYEGRSGEVAGDELERDRYRYRFRLGLTGKMSHNFAWGVRLETANGNRSTNVTFGDEATGPYGKASDTLYLGQVYVQWMPTPEFTLTLGRQANPLVTSYMVWDGDINVEGATEAFKRRVGKFEYSATLSQLIYNSANTQKLLGVPTRVEDLYLFAYQGGLKYYTNDVGTAFFQINPTFYQYVNESGTRNPLITRGTFSPTNQFGINNLFIFDLPIEYTWVTTGGKVMRLYGDYSINLDGEARATKYGRADLADEDTAYLIGYQYGKAVNKGEWDASLTYSSTGAFSLDQNLVDSDIFDSKVNMEGFALKANYALGAATQLAFTYAAGDRKEDSLIAPGAGDIGLSNKLDNYVLLQLDLNVKF